MCNPYSLTKSQAAIRALFRVQHGLTGNLPPLPGIFPDGTAPVIRTGSDGERELAMLQWGMPCPPVYGGQSVTNIRNTKSPLLARVAREEALHRAVPELLRIR